MAESVDSINQNNRMIRIKNITPPKFYPTSAPILHSSVTVAVYWIRSVFDWGQSCWMGVLAPLDLDLDKSVRASDKKLIQWSKKFNVRLIINNLVATCAE